MPLVDSSLKVNSLSVSKGTKGTNGTEGTSIPCDVCMMWRSLAVAFRSPTVHYKMVNSKTNGKRT